MDILKPLSATRRALPILALSLLLISHALGACDEDSKPQAGHAIPVGGPDDGEPKGIETHTGRSVLYTLPEYTLVSHEGQPFGSASLAGKIYVANFFFTSCPSMCPPLMDAMKALQSALTKRGFSDVELVSFSVDPDNDTPETLKLYAQARGLSLRKWTLVTGPRLQIVDLITRHFRTHVGDPETNDQGMLDIAHAGFMVVVDGEGRIRAFIDTSRSPEGQPYAARKDAVPQAMRAIDAVRRRSRK